MSGSGAALTPTPGLVLIVGEEQLLVDRAISSTVLAVRRREPDVERREATAGALSSMEFSDLVAQSLFAEPRVVVIRQAHESSKEMAVAIAQYASDPVDGVVLVVQHNGGARNKALTDGLRKAGAAVLTCDKVTRAAERIEFVRQEIRLAGGRATPNAVAAIVEAVGSDLRELAAVASQLVADTGGLVDESAVRRYHRGRAEVTGFTVADLAVVGDVPGALEALRWALGIGVAPVLVADALADGIRTVAKVFGARAGNGYALSSELGMPPWKIDRARTTARQWSEGGLARAIQVVAEVNAAVKGVAVDADYALEKAVIEVAAARRLT